ncbi:hypothetical protein [Paenibacillus sp. KS-LC4]|uniref:peptidylprolyl isomerase n=1 Tax=Paenibacillus sp. KS-LC4 TaxID=2979727 RepID=UPI0030D50BD0
MTQSIRKKSNKWRLAILASFICLCICLCITLTLTFFNENLTKEGLNDANVIAWVNDEPITIGEFNLYFQRHKSATISFIMNKYNVEVSKDFWTKTYGAGDIPIILAKNATLDELKKIKYEQIMMKQYGVVKDTSYRNFMLEFQNENKRRKELRDNGGIVYGPEQYSVGIYYEYLQSNRLTKLKQMLEKEPLNDGALMKMYDELKDTDRMLKGPETVKVKKLVIPYGPQLTKQEAEVQIKEAKKMIDKGTDFDEVIRQFEKFSKSEDNEEIFDESVQQSEGRLGGPYSRVISKLEVNEVSAIVDWNQSFTLYKVTDQIEGKYKSIQDVKDYLTSKLVDERFDQLVASGTEQSKLSINSIVYDHILVD